VGLASALRHGSREPFAPRARHIPAGLVAPRLDTKKEIKMNGKFVMLLGAALLALASQFALSASADAAACKPGYKRVTHQQSGNKICVIDAVPSGLKLKAK
jgi:hypothetical protein